MSKPDPERPDFARLHYGEMGVIAIALLFLVGFLWLALSPAPLKGLDKFDAVANKARAENIANAEKAQRLRDYEASGGVVTVDIDPPKKH